MNSRVTLPLAVCIVLILFFFSLIIANSVDIPNGDDLYCLLLFAQQFQDAPSWITRLELLFDQWVEHRIVYSRFTALLSYWLTGQVNFIVIIIIGNMTLVGFTILFWKLIKKTGLSMYYLIPVVLTLFSPVTYEANLWAGASTVYMPVAFLGLLTTYILVYHSHGRWGLLLPTLTALLATYSFGNGMFTFISGLAVLVYQKRYKAALLWSVIGFTAVFLYFHDYEGYSSTNAFSFVEHFKQPLYLIYNLLGFTGGILDYAENVNSAVMAANIPALALGFVLFVSICFGCFLFLFKDSPQDSLNIKKVKLAWLGMASFMLITAVAMAYSRTTGSAMNTMSSRYKIYSMIFWTLLYCACLIYFKRKKMIGISFGVLSFLILLFNYYTDYDKLTNYKSYFLSGIYNYTRNGHWIIYRHTSYYEGASKILSDSIARARKPVYAFKPVYPQLNFEALNKADTLRNVKVVCEDNRQSKAGKSIKLHSDEYPSVSNRFKGIYLVVYNESNIYLFAVNPRKNGRLNMLTKGNYYKPGFTLDDSFGNILKVGSEYNLAVFCPTEKQQIKLLPYKLRG